MKSKADYSLSNTHWRSIGEVSYAKDIMRWAELLEIRIEFRWILPKDNIQDHILLDRFMSTR